MANFLLKLTRGCENMSQLLTKSANAGPNPGGVTCAPRLPMQILSRRLAWVHYSATQGLRMGRRWGPNVGKKPDLSPGPTQVHC